jgi:hypothetical protein
LRKQLPVDRDGLLQPIQVGQRASYLPEAEAAAFRHTVDKLAAVFVWIACQGDNDLPTGLLVEVHARDSRYRRSVFIQTVHIRGQFSASVHLGVLSCGERNSPIGG